MTMAISVDYQYRGIIIPSAYVRVDHFSGGKREGKITPDMEGTPLICADVGIYTDSEQQVPFTVASVSVPLQIEETPFYTIYSYLKTLPEFECAIDC